MYEISNALIFDDKINLLTQKEEIEFADATEYKNLKTIHDFFLKNSIPITIINQIGVSAIDVIEKIRKSTKPDLVVLDLDLNSDGEVDDMDTNLLTVILMELKSSFEDFIILIYSSQSEIWPEVKKEILDIEPSLEELLKLENVIVFEKTTDLNKTLNEKLSSEILTTKNKYFDRQIMLFNKIIRSKWNKEVLILLFFSLVFLTIIQFSFKETSKTFYISSMLIIIFVSLSYISFNKVSNDINK